MSKNVGNIEINKGGPAYTNEDKMAMANAPDFKPETNVNVQAEAPEVYEQEGKKIYEKTKSTGDVKYFDTNGAEVSTRIVDILFEQYPAPPEFNQQGGEKKGGLQVTNAEYQRHGNEFFEEGKLPEYVVERQDYTMGETYQATIPKEQYTLVRFLRGEFSGK
jgi:hypothetical protein